MFVCSFFLDGFFDFVFLLRVFSFQLRLRLFPLDCGKKDAAGLAAKRSNANVYRAAV